MKSDMRGGYIVGKESKQFPLSDKENCKIYLCRIISTCELCLDRLKIYNNKMKDVLDQYAPNGLIPQETYSELCDMASNIECYLLNILGDSQSSSISYFKYRNEVEKQKKKGNLPDVQLSPIDSELEEILYSRVKTFGK